MQAIIQVNELDLMLMDSLLDSCLLVLDFIASRTLSLFSPFLLYLGELLQGLLLPVRAFGFFALKAKERQFFVLRFSLTDLIGITTIDLATRVQRVVENGISLATW